MYGFAGDVSIPEDQFPSLIVRGDKKKMRTAIIMQYLQIVN